MASFEKLLVEKKRELIKEQDIYGRTALHYAASYYRLEMVKLLIEKDSSVAYIQDKDGRSPLHYAAGKGNFWTTREIMERYPDAVDLVDNKGQNAFHVCIDNYNQEEGRLYELVMENIMSEYRNNDEVINQADKDGNTPLHLAVKRCSPYLVKYLLKKLKGRVDTDAINNANLTPLDLALSGIYPQAKEEKQVRLALLKADAKSGMAKPLQESIICLNDTERMVEEYNTRTKAMNKPQIIVATLIATVTFAAAFQVPGGYKSDDGRATLARKAAFQAFVITDAIALTCSMTAVFLNFIMPLLRGRWPLKTIRFVAILSLIAMVAMLVAFVSGLYVVLTNSLWLAIFTCFVVFGFCCLFLVFWKISLKSDDLVSDSYAVKKMWKSKDDDGMINFRNLLFHLG
ncbi:hypothetical protein HHK36_022040 [Tetracentron sinense]|uniref:PGG domain-containing protein n=1 Tax=Tetracentron sinense TaxID=13715 RepID=A0A834YUD6_TETSI|nr:hypothetical protein HHK36_022040 [Tetracentron sinense]